MSSKLVWYMPFWSFLSVLLETIIIRFCINLTFPLVNILWVFTFENLTQYHLIKYVRGEIKKLHFLATKKIVNGFKEYFCLRNKINVPGLIQIYFVLNVISYTKIISLKISPK